MQKTKAAIVGILALFAVATASAQQFPVVPDRTVIGRIGAGGGSGPSQAIPFATLSAQLLGGSNIFTGDALFRSGRPWCDVRANGAVGDGVTNDAVAFRACVSTLVALGGGTLYVPPSTNPYCVIDGTSGIDLTSTTASIRIVGSNEANSVLSACGVNTAPVVRMNTPKSSVENLYVLGYGLRSTDAFGVAAFPALQMNPGCSFCRAENVTVNGGTNNVQLQNANYALRNVTAQYAYGSALVYSITGGGYIESSHLDQVWPISVPANGATLGAWAGTTGCTAGKVVSTGGYYIQYSNVGTSGGVAPTLKNYGQAITDGTCTAFLVGPTTYYAIQADTAVNEMQISHTDTTGAFTAGIALTNTFAGVAPTSVSIIGGVTGQSISAGVLATSGSELSILDFHISRCVLTGCAGVDLTGSWTGPANITNLRVMNNVSYGIFNRAGSKLNVTGAEIATAGISAFTVGANINSFSITNSSLGSTSLGTNVNAVTVTAGTSDRYNITGNNIFGFTGTGIVDNGSGTNKLVGGNEGPWSVPNGGTGLAAGTSGGIPYFNTTSTMGASALLAATEIVVGGGAGNPPNTGTGCNITNASVICTNSVSAFPQFTLTNTTSDAVAPAFLWRKSRSGGNTLASDFLGDLEFYGFANAALSITGRIQYQQTAASSGSNIPGKFVFSTSNAAGQINQTMILDGNSHISNTQVTAPSVTAGCNGAGVSVAGTDLAGTVTGQTAAATTCTLTFGTAYAAAPNCAITGLSSPLTGAITVAAGTIITNFASTANYKWSYVCHGA